MIGIGQSMRVSPLQALAIVNTVVNNGVYVKPYLVDSLVNNNGDEIERFTTIKNKVLKKYCLNSKGTYEKSGNR